jgi:PiT family inorganic phosphate transporter
MIIIFAGLVGGILWNLLTWLLGLPSSSSHALFGGLIGAGIAGAATVNWAGIVGKIIVPAVLSPLIAGVVAAIGTWLVYRLTRTVHAKHREAGFRWGQIGTASLVSLAHGTGDAQKTMGVIALALIAHGTLTGDQILNEGLPIWIIVTCGAAIARHLPRRLADHPHPRQGTRRDRVAAGSRRRGLLRRDHPHLELDGHGAVHHARRHGLDPRIRRGSPGRAGALGHRRSRGHGVVDHHAAAGVVGALCFFLAHGIGGLAGAITVFLLLLAAAALMYLRSRRQKVDHHNVNAEWDGSLAPNSAAQGATA